MPAPTIRSWERRYGVPVADRSSGGHRRYTLDQLDRLRWMRDLIAQGRRPVRGGRPGEGRPRDITRTAGGGVPPGRSRPGARAASLGPWRSPARPWGSTAPSTRCSCRRCARSANGGTPAGSTSPTSIWRPTRPGPGCRRSPSTGPLRPQPPIILSCGPRDHHTLGLEAICALLRHRRWDCRLLGARTPVESLSHAVQETNAAAVVLVCHVTAGRPDAVEALRSAERWGTHLFYAGGAFASRRARQGVPGRYLGTNLARAADLVTDTITSTRAGRSH